MSSRPQQAVLKRTLLASAIMASVGLQSTMAATINVDGSTCTLADAITAANTDAVVGGCSAGAGADVLELVNGTFALTATLPTVLSPITINGNGATISGDQTFRLLQVNDGVGSTTGDLTINDAVLSQGASGSGNDPNLGGGIACYDGAVNLTNTTVTETTGGAVVLNRCSSTVNGSAIVSNTSNDSTVNAAGLSINGGEATITGSTISDNTSSNFFGGGGGIFISNADGDAIVTINSSTIAGNTTGDRGGGIAHVGGGNSTTLTVANSTISGNSAFTGGGGLGLAGAGLTATIENTTITDNTTQGGGTGSFIGGGLLNDGANVTVRQSIIAGNQASYANTNEIEVLSGNVTLDAFNVIGVAGADGVSNVTVGASDIIPPGAIDTVLDITLADNGGPTLTHLLVAGSPAIDLVGLTACANPSDQRGIARPIDGDNSRTAECDAGALEALRPNFDADLSLALADSASSPVVIGDQFQLNFTASNSGPLDGTGVTVIGNLSPLLTYLSDDCGASVVDNTLTWVVGNLPVNATDVCNVTVEVTTLGTISTTGTISGDQDDPTPDNNAATSNIFGRPVVVPTMSWYGLLALSLGLVWVARRRIVVA